mmetsp:Transcript_7204/g.18446  ORF Transcript_7204/g.18446 Transcript_7204/m.18446 type:complete len:205 (-) Transcript_7204:24-638(-)
MARVPLIILMAAAFAPVGSSWDLQPTTGLCANQIAGAISDVSSILYDIVQAVSDCDSSTWSEDDFLQAGQKNCAGDLTQFLSDSGDMTSQLAGAVYYCGSIQDSCIGGIGDAFSDLFGGANALVAASADCETDPFLCTFDSLNALNSFSKFGGDIDAEDALLACNGKNDAFADWIIYDGSRRLRGIDNTPVLKMYGSITHAPVE